MLEIAAVTGVVAAIASVIDLTDKVFGSWSRFSQTREVEATPATAPAHYETVETTPQGGLTHVVGGAPAETVTREQLSARLGPQDAQVIEALERKMATLVAQWSAITANYDLTIDPAHKAILKIKLDDIGRELSTALLQVIGILEQLGFKLQDHYASIRQITKLKK